MGRHAPFPEFDTINEVRSTGRVSAIPGSICAAGAAATADYFGVTNVFQQRQLQAGFKFTF